MNTHLEEFGWSVSRSESMNRIPAGQNELPFARFHDVCAWPYISEAQLGFYSVTVSAVEKKSAAGHFVRLVA